MTEHASASRDAPPRVGVSACLLGQNTRHDGGNTLDAVVVDIIGAAVEFVPVCPEMETGMGSPRPPIRLVDGPDGLRAKRVDDPAVDATDELDAVGHRQTGLSGFILKSRSPSCGVGNTDVFSPTGSLISSVGSGVFTRSIMKTAPLLPVEDETNLRDSARRNAFLLRVFVYDGWIRLVDRGDSAFAGFVEKTDFIKSSLDTRTRRRLDSLTAPALKSGKLIVGEKYLTALLSALRSAPPDGPVRDAADLAVNLLSKRKHAVINGGR